MRFAGRPSRCWRAAALAGILLAAATTAASAEVTFFGLMFPDRVADAEIGPTTDFEQSKPGLGYGVRYRKPGWTIDVYIYDLGRTSIPEGAESGMLKSELKEAQDDIRELQRRGEYAKVDLVRTYVVRDRRGRPRLQCSDFNYVHEQTGAVDSVLCLTGWKDKFVKFRLTSAHHRGSQAETRRFLDAWIPILWP